jgi:Na+/melibiose symporter-like transporter
MHDRPDEDEQTRLARNMGELLQELRVAQAGVQILFAFLLSVTFSARFGQATTLQRATLTVTILLTTASAVLLIAPVVWHRLCFRQGRRADIIRWGSRCALGGALLLALAMAGAVLVTTAAIVGSAIAIVFACCAAAMFVTMWLLLPFTLRSGRKSGSAEQAASTQPLSR